MRKRIEIIIDLNILFDELLSVSNSKKYKKDFKGTSTIIDGMKKAFIRNENLGKNLYRVNDFIKILKFDFNKENKIDVEYEFLRKSENMQELIWIKDDQEYMIAYYLKKLLIIFVYEKFKKLMGEEFEIIKVIDELKEDIGGEFNQTLIICMLIYSYLHNVKEVEYFNQINTLYVKFLERKMVADQEKRSKEYEKKETKLKKAIDDLSIEREEKKEVNTKLKDLKKKYNTLSDENKSLIRALEGLESKFKQPVEFTSKVKNEIKNMIIEEKNLALEKVFQGSLDSLNRKFILERVKNEKLESKIKSLNIEVEELKKEVERLEISEVSISLLHEYTEEKIDEREDENKKVDLRFFAKIIIEDNRYYLRFNGSEVEFNEERERKYYVQGEIVVIDGNKNIIEQTDCYDDKMASGLKYGKLYKDCDGLHVADAYGNKVFDVRECENLSTASIVAYNSNLEIKIAFKRIKDNIDLYRECIEAKKHRPLIVTNIISRNLVVRNALTDKEGIINIDEIEGLNEEIIDVGEVLMLNKDNGFIGIIDNRYYYTLSKNYNRKETVVVKYIGSEAYADKLNGERIKLNSCNKDIIDDGAICIIDEFNNILYETDNQLVRRKIFKESKVNNSTGVNENIEIVDEIAIVGRTNYKETYKLTFLKNGVEVKFVDGNDNYSKIQQGLKDMEKIIVCVSGVSHGNMWRIKEDYADRNIIYPDRDGANRLYSEYLNM